MHAPALKGITYRLIGGDGREYGPAPIDDLRAWAAEGRVGPSSMVWRSDEERWQPARAWPELRWDLPVPEAPPVPPPVPSPAPSVLPAAGFLPRVAAYLCDAFVLAVVTAVVTIPWSGELSALQKLAMEQVGQPSPDMAIVLRFWMVSMAIHLPLSALYHIGFNTRLGATPGKLLGGMRVVAADDSPLGLGRAVARYAAELMSILPFGMGYLVVAVHPERRALHDLLAGTRVVFRRGR